MAKKIYFYLIMSVKFMDCWSMKKNFVISEKENKLGEQVDGLEKTTARRCIYSFKKVSN